MPEEGCRGMVFFAGGISQVVVMHRETGDLRLTTWTIDRFTTALQDGNG